MLSRQDADSPTPSLRRQLAWVSGLAVIALPLMGGLAAADRAKVIRFDPKDYADSSTFRVSRAQYPHHGVTIRVIQVEKIDGRTNPPPRLCRAWLEVRMQGKVLRQLYFDDIESMGWFYGIFIPHNQPLDDYFLATKHGDYDSRLLMIGADGSLTNLPGGIYFLTADRRFLVGEQAKDTHALIVVDVASRRVVIDGWNQHAGNEVAKWYLDATGYFFTEYAEGSDQGPAREAPGHAFRLDLDRHRVVRVPMSAQHLSAAKRIRYDFDLHGARDCTSIPQ